MTVFLGNSGRVRLRRSTSERTFLSTVDPGDVNADKNRFSFDFPQEMLQTGDRLQIQSTNGVNLTFVDGSGWEDGTQRPDGTWYANIDQIGGISLYDTFADALNGGIENKIPLAAIAESIPIQVKSVQGTYNILGLVRSFELNNDREVVDVTGLSDEFRKNESGLISGSGSVSCEFHYDPDAAGLSVDTDMPSYLHELILRQKLGAEFDAELYIVEKGENAEATNDFFYFEFKGVVTNAAVGLGTGEITVSNFNFVTTGPITPKLGKGSLSDSSYLLTEDDDRILLEQPGNGKLELED